MSTQLSIAFAPPPKLSKRSTLADVLDRIYPDETLSSEKRRSIRCAFRAVARACNKPLDMISADPRLLGKELDQLTPAMANLTPASWANAVFFTRHGLRHVGLIQPVARGEPFAPRWRALLRLMGDSPEQIGLSRLMRFCTTHGIDPDDVNDDVFAAFLKEITEDALIRQPHKLHRRTATIWNKMVRTTRNWPTQAVQVPSYSKVYFVGWDRFPATLQAEVQAYLSSRDGSDLDRNLDVAPLKPRSIKTQQHQLGAYLSALVLKGEDPADLHSLADAVDQRRVRLGLRFFLDRPSGQAKKYAHEIARTLLSIARHWAKADPVDITALQKICKILKTDTAMTLKTRTRVRQFDDTQAFQRLSELPRALVAQANRAEDTPTQADALLVQTAVAIELLLMVPIRRHNLVALKLDEHIVRQRSGSACLFIPGEQVKNGQDIEAALPAELMQLVDLYVARYRPILDPDRTSSYLFPGLPGRHKSRERLALQVSETIKEKLGLLVNVHLFRAIAAKVYLDRHPGGYGVLKHLCGHKSLATTIRSYCGLEGKSAIGHYETFILGMRKAATPAGKRGSYDGNR